MSQKKMTIKASSSAPGKAILFGEHAVVYGVTAIAVALSDLRIRVDVEVTEGSADTLSVIFADIKTDSGEEVVGTITLTRLQELFPLTPSLEMVPVLHPSLEAQNALQSEFSSYPPAAAQGLACAAYLFAHMVRPSLCMALPTHGQASIRIQSQGLPIGAGLGSSGAYSVALGGALLLTYLRILNNSINSSNSHSNASNNQAVLMEKEQREVINAWAYAGEVLMHGSPSGLDNTTSCFGGMVKFKKDIEIASKEKEKGGFELLSPAVSLEILLVNTKIGRSTKALVGGVRSLSETFPSVLRNVNNSIQSITETFLERMQGLGEGESVKEREKVVGEIGVLMEMNHHLLCSLGVSHPSLDLIVSLAKQHGHRGKLTGAGGGGCALVLLGGRGERKEGQEESREGGLEGELVGRGWEVLRTKIGGGGVEWH